MRFPLNLEELSYLESLTFNQKFKIADEKIAEAILDIDFLEANKCVIANW